MPSGKQVLLSVLQQYSQGLQKDSELDEVTDVIKSALCAHCSTSGETMEKIQRMRWLSESEDDDVVKQGLGLEGANVFLSDLVEELIEDDTIPEKIKSRFPEITQVQYTTGLDMIWWLLSSLQYFDELKSVENKGYLDDEDRERMLNDYSKWLDKYKNEPW